MIDNLFVVESPLQALIAVELSLFFKDKKNFLIYRLADKSRARNNEQIERVIRYGAWSKTINLSFSNTTILARHTSIRKQLKKLEKELKGNVDQLFLGEFRSQWMHFLRAVSLPYKTILMDDGAATVTVKRRFMDNNIYYPESIWKSKSKIKELAKKFLYYNFLSKKILRNKVYLASTFFKDESLYNIDFSELRGLFQNSESRKNKHKVVFFGSKYSESKIITREYELAFIDRVIKYYSSYSCEFIYYAHRDEDGEKLASIRDVLGAEVLVGQLPAEIFLLKNSDELLEVAAAYSTVLNNAKILLPEVEIKAFHLNPNELNDLFKTDIMAVYKHFEASEIGIVYDEPDRNER